MGMVGAASWCYQLKQHADHPVTYKSPTVYFSLVETNWLHELFGRNAKSAFTALPLGSFAFIRVVPIPISNGEFRELGVRQSGM